MRSTIWGADVEWPRLRKRGRGESRRSPGQPSWLTKGLLFGPAAPLVLALVLTQPAAADRSDCKAKVERSYRIHYAKVKQAHGTRAPGRNIRKNGVLFRKVIFDTTCGELRRSTRQLKRLLTAPAYSTLARTSGPPPQPPAGVESPGLTGVYNGWAIPEYIVMCESGGDYNARNASGAFGAYQIMPGTATGYGCDLSTPRGQDICAAKIWKAQGSAPWVCG